MQNAGKTIPKLSIFIQENDLENGVRKVLEVIRPNWTSKLDKLKSKIFSDGLTNKLYGYYLEDDRDDTVIIKIYGAKTEIMIDREREIQTMKLLQKEKLSSELYATFENGLAYEFVSGQTIDTVTCRNPVIFNLVAAELARLHSITLENENLESRKSGIWSVFERINVMAEEALTMNEGLIKTFKELGITSGWGAKALDELKEIIEKENMVLTFCHNDLLLGNVIYNEKHGKVTFIDFEYCVVNYAPFDVANHFCEFAGGNDTDFSICPDDEFKSKWIDIYLKHLYHGKHSYDTETFLKWVNICTPLSFVGWILWGIAQANNSTLDFDYIEYVRIRIPEYEKFMKLVRKS